VLAHVVGDFVLQPYDLVRLKVRPIGLVIHTAIHTALVAVATAPFFERWWAIAGIVAVTHYLIDWAKVTYDPGTGPASLVAFLLDQAAHLAVLALALPLAGVPWNAQVIYQPPELQALIYYLLPYLVVTSATAIFVYQVALAFRTRARPRTLLDPLPRLRGMLERALLLTLLLFFPPALWWLGLLVPVAQVARNRTWGQAAELFCGLGVTTVVGLLTR
jgi:hypothetical protein